jgi:hypothetical protein
MIQLKKKKIVRTIITQKCKGIFYNVILWMKFCTNKYLFYNCYVYCCYCVVWPVFNLSVCREDKHAIHTQSVIHCAHHQGKHRRLVSIIVFRRQRELFTSTSRRETPTFCVCQCIPEVKGIVHIHITHHRGKHRLFVSVSVF